MAFVVSTGLEDNFGLFLDPLRALDMMAPNHDSNTNSIKEVNERRKANIKNGVDAGAVSALRKQLSVIVHSGPPMLCPARSYFFSFEQVAQARLGIRRHQRSQMGHQ
uniref:Uncharacterized protein n=1 Tax=Grammatophora oceanica TaxID=210454 RepID=A0A6U5J116_9STRA|mmetsp:Transcript_23646/g.34996  ORF Transcript_23646/g.34996 Transcript_23646/m.34996 type:complete len:107 (+) Transcript_23646:317-637(+)